jgi:hypothetical protein
MDGGSEHRTVLEAAATGKAATVAMGGGQRKKEGEWQTVTSSKNQKTGAGKAKKATPAKVA